MRKILGCFIIIMIMITSQVFAGTIYYVDATNGSDSNSGTSSAIAWKTITKANNTLTAGDTVYVMAGTYEETIYPSNSGTSGNPITYKNYNDDEVIIKGVEVGINFAFRDYITVDGFKLNNDSQESSDMIMGVQFTDSDYCIVQNCKIKYIKVGGSDAGIWMNENHQSSYCQILSNTIEYVGQNNSDIGNGIWLKGDHHIVSGNTVDFCGHAGIYVDADKSIIKNNTCYGSWAKPMNIGTTDTSYRFTVEDNTLRSIHAYASPWAPSAGVQIDGCNIIFRRNKIYDGYGEGIEVYGGDPNYYNHHLRVYNNVIYGMGTEYISPYKYGLLIIEHDTHGHMSDCDYRNNIFYNNYADGVHYDSYADPADHNLTHNHWNSSGDPKFENPATGDFRIQTDSPCINAGIWLTQTNGSGSSSTTMIVDDAKFFTDGFGIQDGDVIKLESQTKTVKTINVDYDNNIITVDSPLTWYSGQGVSLAYFNYAPDIGAYEYQGSVSPLNAEINASPTSGYVPLAVSFTGSASGGTAPYSYSWDFGDGSSSSDQNPSHTYSSAGTLTVTLTVTDSSSSQATDSLIITATSPTSALSASASASTTSGEAPLTVNFTGSASGGTSPYTYSWNFGDGQSSSSQNPAHTYSSAVNYIVILTVTDSKSSTATDSLTINVQEKTSSLQVSTSASPTSGQVPLTVSFTGSASGGTAPYSYSWNFGDGQSSSSQNPSHTYSSAGTYNVTLTVTDSTSSQASASIAITAQTQISVLAASCTASPTSGDIPLTVNFTGTAAGGISPYVYSWNFGDGQSSSSQNPSHTYSSAGTYTITLTVTDSTASQATASTEVTTSAPVHEVTVPDTPEGSSTGATGVSYTYTTGGSSCSQGHSVEYYFDWGDGTYSFWSSSTSASHIWSAAGTYSAKVQARCSVNPGVTSLWSEGKTVSLEESPNLQLNISSATASPAPGQGGSTNPDTGSYPYPAGNTAQVTALPATNYRFSKWTGDISGSDSYNSEITFNMDQDKSISALFCTQCGDVNGDLSITPADAQYVFEMFLGIISNATETQKENADVNCDGTATEPNITPADAQAIFEKFLGISELPGDCSCRSRADASSTAFTQKNRSQTAPLEIQPGTPNIQLTIDDIDARFKREISIPVRINNPFNIKSFGFDLIFDSGTLEFVGIEIGSLLNGFTMVDAKEISEGVVRVGGFSSEPIMTSSPSVLVRLKFRVSGRVKEPSPLSIINTVDDIKNAATRSGVVFYKEINDKIMRNKNVF